MEDIVLIGFGGHSKSVIDSIERQNQYRIIGLLEKQQDMVKEYRGYKVLGNDEMLRELYQDGIRNAFVTIGYMGNSKVRNRIYETLKEIGFQLPTIIDPSAIVADDVIIGEGTFIGKNAILNSEVKIGKMCIINTGAILEHEVVVSDYCHISVGSILCGQARVEKEAFVGAGSIVIQGKQIGTKSIIGAGAIIVKDILEETLAYGNVMKKCREEKL